MTYEQLERINASISKVDIKGKAYAMVNDKVLGFRQLYPNGGIKTELLSNENGMCVVQAFAYDEDGKLLGSGLAYEKESSSFINKTSYIENCETSAIGRCLSSIGIGCEDNYCSADELGNALMQKPISDKQAETLKKMIALADGAINPMDLFGKPVDEINSAAYNKACHAIEAELEKLGIKA